MQTGRRFVGWAKPQDARSSSAGVPTMRRVHSDRNGGHVIARAFARPCLPTIRARFVGWAKRSDARSAVDGVPTIELAVWNKDGGHGARAPLPTLRIRTG